MAVVIKAENISKAYQLGEFSTGTLTQDIERAWHRIRGKEDPFLKIGETNDRTTKGASNMVWSLKDISFKIDQGDAVGIIGKNGAGKSTLLKVLSRVTTPTTGTIKVRGRIASLLEVGTGFHPELTGRENIFLNGAILGMRKFEIAKKFDEIVDFAGVERYIDTPVKRYSSGMYVRLAFAVAAHLENEILVVDEVLAVGDAEFQKKCLGKMKNVSKGEGRTVLFVSHNMDAISNLCNNGIVLKTGEVAFSGSARESINFYQTIHQKDKSNTWESQELRDSPCIMKIESMLIGVQPDLGVKLKIRVHGNESFRPAFLAADIHNSMGTSIMQALPILEPFIKFNGQFIDYEMTIQLNGLVPDNYSISIWMGPHNNETYHYLEEIISFEITDSPTTGRTFPHTPDHGFMVPVSEINLV